MKMYFPSLLLSSVFSLSALITAVYKSHESICGLVISRTPQSGDVLLLSLSPAFFLTKKEGLRARIINLFF